MQKANIDPKEVEDVIMGCGTPEGATGVNFTEVGEAFGSFLEKEIKGGKFKTKKQR